MIQLDFGISKIFINQSAYRWLTQTCIQNLFDRSFGSENNQLLHLSKGNHTNKANYPIAEKYPRFVKIV